LLYFLGPRIKEPQLTKTVHYFDIVPENQDFSSLKAKKFPTTAAAESAIVLLCFFSELRKFSKQKKEIDL
jgi:hypothetical protein